MSTGWTYVSIIGYSLLWLLAQAYADVAHFFAAPSEFGSYLHGQVPFQVALSPPGLYGSPIAAPAPVAPLPSTTTELPIPEIIDDRRVKSVSPAHGSFIPLQHYLPPGQEERPTYDSPKPSDDFSGYYYAHPSVGSTTRIPVTRTTSQRPIVVQNSDEDNEPRPGYNYAAPAEQGTTPAAVYLPAEKTIPGQQQLRVRIEDMRCLQHGYFRAVLKLDSFLGATPVVDNDMEDEQNDRCELKLSRSFLLLEVAAENFEACGVRNCGQDLCLRLRFPAIRGIRTSKDSILTLHCKMQERVAIKTHALKVGVSKDVQARSMGNYAHGGHQNPFRTHVELLRLASDGGFKRHLESNGAVQLGEELLLRAHVLSGDGWNYTKLSDVQLQRISNTGEVLHSASLITSRGCLNPAMQDICPQAPYADSPLGQRLHFKAIMFPGMHSGDVLVMSMRITGCLHREDCQQITQDCLPNVAKRRRRNTMGNETEVSNNSISFKVFARSIEEEEEEEERSAVVQDVSNQGIPHLSKSLALFGTLGFVVLLLGVLIIAFYKLEKYAR